MALEFQRNKRRATVEQEEKVLPRKPPQGRLTQGQRRRGGGGGGPAQAQTVAEHGGEGSSPRRRPVTLPLHLTDPLSAILCLNELQEQTDLRGT